MENKRTLAIQIFWRLLAAAALLLVLHLTFQYLNLERYHEKQGQVFELSNRVDFDDEASLPTWFSQFLLLSIGCGAILASRFEQARSDKRAWRMIGLAAILFSIDEIASVHEFILQTLYLLYYGDVIPTLQQSAWLVVAPFILLGGLLVVWWLYRILPRATWLVFFAGGSMYLIGAAGFEFISNDVAKNTFMYQGIMTGIEEMFEIIGSIVVLYGVINYLENRHSEKIRQALKNFPR
jgi:hypothetical protein